MSALPEWARWCPDCCNGSSAVLVGPINGIVIVHSRKDCDRIARDGQLAHLTDEDRVLLREHGWNGR